MYVAIRTLFASMDIAMWLLFFVNDNYGQIAYLNVQQRRFQSVVECFIIFQTSIICILYYITRLKLDAVRLCLSFLIFFFNIPLESVYKKGGHEKNIA